MAKLLRYCFEVSRHPVWLYDRLCGRRQIKADGTSRVSYTTQEWYEAVERLAAKFGSSVDSILSEPALLEVEALVQSRSAQIPPDSPYPLSFNSDFLLARFCYLACRLMKPTTVVETGVCYGVGSAFLLQALKVNNHGHLYSIDLPPLGRKPSDWVGITVPAELRSRWTIKLGASKRILPRLLKQLGSVDIFFHDSLHTYSNMSLEFRLVEPYLSRAALVIADDIHGNRAFQEWTGRLRSPVWGAVQENDKSSVFGFAMY
jgi:hypothetical protein